MITVKMIADRLLEILAELYPSCTFYAHSLPDSIARPSFNIYLEADRSEDSSLISTNETVSMGIVYYSPLTEPIADELKHFAVYSNIRNIFRMGYIRVGGRSLKVVLLRGGKQDNEIYLIVKLVYVDDRPQDDTGSGTTYDLIGEVNIRTERNNS
jgi:hypothetical protein